MPASASIRGAARRGLRLVRDYTGTVLAVYAIQFVLAAGAAVITAQALASSFAGSDLLDRAIAGDLAAIARAVRAAPQAFVAGAWAAVVATIAYLAVSWGLTGGVLAVALDEPEGRRPVAACFGAGAASSWFPFARLAIVALAGDALVVLALLGGALLALPRIETALTLWQLAGALALLLPAAALLLLVHTAADYARVDLVRHPGLSSVRSLVRGLVTVTTSPRPLAHVLLYWLLFAAVTAGYAALTFGRPMVGAAGMASLFALRQTVVLVRCCGKIALVGGQVSLSQALQGPPLSRRARRG
jgi:hypothetical protein